MSPERMPRSSDNALALAAALGLLRRTRSTSPRRAFLTLASTEEPPAGERSMERVHGGGESPERRAVEHPHECVKAHEGAAETGIDEQTKEQIKARTRRYLRATTRENTMGRREAEDARLQFEAAVLQRRSFLGNVLALNETGQALETLKRDAEKYQGKGAEATADYLATVIGDPIYRETIGRVKVESVPETEPIEVIEGVDGLLQTMVDTPLKALGSMLRFSPVETTVSAGITTDLILAPITEPLDKAESYIEIGGIIVGLLTGGHGLVVAFIKPLLHSQLKHLLSRIFLNALRGPRSAHPEADSQASTPPPWLHRAVESRDSKRDPAVTVPVIQRMKPGSVASLGADAARRLGREATREDPLWLCIVVERRSETADLAQPESSADPATSTTGTAAERDITKLPVLSMGDDEFTSMLPTVLRGSTVSETGVPTAQTMGELATGRYFTLRAEGVGVGAFFSANSGSQAAYQHPGCLTGHCVPPGGPRCLCPCDACRSLYDCLSVSVASSGSSAELARASLKSDDTKCVSVRR